MSDYTILLAPGQQPDMDYGQFAAILTAGGSPGAGEAHAIYSNLLANGGVQPGAFLAFWWVESHYGTLGVQAKYTTRNPGNVRTPEDNTLATGSIKTPDRGSFAIYPSWAAGALDWNKRIRGPKYAGRGLTTVRQVLPVYAPKSDSNNPTAYSDTVLALIAQWQKEHPMSTQPIPVKLNAVLTALDIRHLLPKNDKGGDSRKSSPKRGVIVHYNGPAVDMDRPGLDAYSSDATFHIGPYLNEYSIAYHWGIAGDGTLYQLRDWDATLWHCGAWPENMTWWAINVWLGEGQHARPAQIATAVLLLDYLSQADGFSKQNVKGHQEVSATACPGTLMADLVLPYRAGEFNAPAPQDATAKERSLLLSYGEAVNATLTGTLEREGVYDATEFSGGVAERLAVYSRCVVNRLRGESYVMPLELWDRLRGQGKVVLY